MSTRLEIGATAPNFTLPDAQGKEVSLTDFHGQNVIVYFYPRANTPGCTKEACDFRDNLNSFKADGYAVIGISPDTPEKIANFIEKQDLNFPLLADPEKEVLKAYGAFGEKNNYGKVVQGVIRSTFVVDPEGKIALAQYNVRATGHVAKLRRDLKLDS